jgi:hypothetical protein
MGWEIVDEEDDIDDEGDNNAETDWLHLLEIEHSTICLEKIDLSLV